MDIKKELEKRLTRDRFEHVLRVVTYAKSLAEKYGVSVEDAEQAALFHDIAKCMEKETLRQLLRESGADQRLLHFHPELWHGPVGAYIAREEFGVTNEDVLNAVRYHTTGRAQMSRLEKVIFVADLLEPGRQFAGVEQLRVLAGESLEVAMETSICHSMSYLVSRKAVIFPDTLDCYNEHVSE